MRVVAKGHTMADVAFVVNDNMEVSCKSAPLPGQVFRHVSGPVKNDGAGLNISLTVGHTGLASTNVMPDTCDYSKVRQHRTRTAQSVANLSALTWSASIKYLESLLFSNKVRIPVTYRHS
jgi:hypothetical protein